MLNKTSIEKYLLQNLAAQTEIKVFDSVSSTNDIAKTIELSPEKVYAIITADHQSQGRGRMNRQFISPPAAGIYLSLLLPALPLDKLLLATPAAAVAAAEAVAETTGIAPSIKWVNDLYIDNNKIGGILTEAVTNHKTGQISHLVVGIGINCTDAGIPSDERNQIGSLNISHLDKNMLVAAIFNKLVAIFDSIKKDDISFMYKYRHMSNLIGKKITVYRSHMDQSSCLDATAVDIDCSGNLVVEFADGTVEHLSSGEVSVREI
ncbi:MAG: biotin--[acetyl-CoA-carboxylase] ligase [Eubacterium sp.]|nr:biotin--[acetyl-CoA-carboxylase] ligase [Eubacterium sp.]